MEIKWERIKNISSDNAFKDFEDEFDYKILDEYKTLLKKYNGGRPNKECFDIPKKEMVLGRLLSMNKEDVENTYFFSKFFMKNNKLVMFPFAITPFGDLICEKGGKVVYWFHEEDKIYNIASSLEEFLNMLYIPEE